MDPRLSSQNCKFLIISFSVLFFNTQLKRPGYKETTPDIDFYSENLGAMLEY